MQFRTQTDISKCFSKAPHIRSHTAPCSCFLRKVSLQLSFEESESDVWIAQLDRTILFRQQLKGHLSQEA